MNFYSAKIVVFAFLHFWGVNTIRKASFGQIRTRSSDTIYSPINRYAQKINALDTRCAILGGYYNLHEVIISNYYLIKDSLRIVLKDGTVNNIFILSPTSLDEKKDTCVINADRSPERLLIDIAMVNGKSKLLGIYHNLLSNSGGVLSHYNGIYKTYNGFKVIHEAGERYSWIYSTEFEIIQGKLILTRIDKSCSFNGKSKTITHFYHKYSNAFNITDTLAKQCNCDPTWSKLDKK